MQEKNNISENNFSNTLDTPQKRLKYFIDVVFDGHKTNFVKAMGMNQLQDIYKYIGKGKSKFVGSDKEKKLSNMGLNFNWYLTGEGDMMNTDSLNDSNQNTHVKFKMPDIENLSIAEMRDVLKWIDANYKKINSIVKSLDDI